MITGKDMGTLRRWAVSDDDTSGYRLIRSEKIAISTENLLLAVFVYDMADGAVSRQPPAGL